MKPPQITIHPYANFFPMIEGKPFENLVEDIKINGQREPILIIKKPGEICIVDGRNRNKACGVAGVTPKYVEWDGKGDLLALVMSLNLTRRHLTPMQRAAAVVPYKKHLAVEAKKRQKAGKPSVKIHGRSSGDARDQAADIAECSNTYVDLAEKAFDEAPDLYAEIVGNKANYAQARNRLMKKKRLRSLPAKAKPSKDYRIVVGDCIKVMDRFTPNSARVVFADPPYNNGWKYDGDVTRDDLPAGEYLDWCQAWMAAAARLLTADGSLFVLIDDNYSDHFGIILRRLGLRRRNTIIWWEHFPQHTSGNFSRAVRFIHYYTKSDKFIWHPERVESARQKQLDKRAVADGKVPDNVWPITRKVGNATDSVPFDDSPPQLPDEVPMWCILAASDPGDMIIDPFNGNGTTGRAALLSGRKYTGIERSPLYAKQSERWIQEALKGIK